jgi:cyanosortase A-associated protein
MVISRWQSFRIFAIAGTLGSVLWVILRVILTPETVNSAQLNAFDFPEKVPLASWQLQNTRPLKATDASNFNSGQQYQYVKNRDRLTVQTRYEHYTDGNVRRLLVVYVPIKPAMAQLAIKYRENAGYYGLFEYEGKAYLSACLNSTGQSTVTEQQFVQNRYAYGWNLKRSLLWIIGQNDLLDGSCFWTLMSVPLSSDSYEIAIAKAYRDLEAAWFEWYQWWKPVLKDR